VRVFSGGLSFLAVVGILLTSATPAAAERLSARPFVAARKVLVGQPVDVVVELVNPDASPVGPVSITMEGLAGAPVTITDVIVPRAGFKSVTISGGRNLPGTYDGRITVVSANGARLASVPTGSVEFVESPSQFSSYRDVVPVGAALLALVGTCITLIVTTVTQSRTLRATREQKATESAGQVILTTARDYYGAVSGAITYIASALRRLKPGLSDAEREHLLARAFFFYGTLLYRDNEFAFASNVIFLQDLWAEDAVRMLVDDTLALLPLTRSQEAIIHKCFSDIALIQRDTTPAPDVSMRVRNVYEFEHALRDPMPISNAHRELQVVYGALKAEFAKPEVIDRILEMDRILRALIEYEFTELFSDFYRDRGGRGRPANLVEFDEIAGGTARWSEVTAALTRWEEEGRRRRAKISG
jgi:hypothetical protein